MVSPIKKKSLFLAFALLCQTILMAQAPANDNCSGAIALTSNLSCTATSGNINNATRSFTTGATCGPSTNPYDVWYKFTAVSTAHTITINNFGSDFWNQEVQLYNGGGSPGTCPTVSTGYVGCAVAGGTGSATINITTLTVGNVYFIKVGDAWNSHTVNATFNICVTHQLNAASINDDCSKAATLTPGISCSSITANLRNANSTSTPTGTCGGATLTTTYDVWFQFQATSPIAIINLSNLGANFTAANTYIQTYSRSGVCAGLTSLGCQNATSSQIFNTLTIGDTYYVRVYVTANPTATPLAAWNFDICVYSQSVNSSTMNEVFKQTTLVPQASGLNDPWEVTYGPDDSLWITVAKDYKILKMHKTNGGYRTILDLSPTGTGYLTSTEHTNYNRGTFTLNGSATPYAINWPQGGMMGLAIHPDFNATTPKRYIYVAYIRTQGTQNTDGTGQFYTNFLVRFTFNTTSGLLESPVTLCDTIPGSSDHNSARMIIAPINGVNYLFYSQGDMGAGQFGNLSRLNYAQDINRYEGKIFRFNLEEDGDAVQNIGVRNVNYNRWIPSGTGVAANPYNTYLGKQSAVWSMGHRNVQGFAAANLGGTDYLYGSSHGPYSDDELNVMEAGRNYGHPLVIGKSADGNYNEAKAGVAAGSLPLLSATGEADNVIAINALPFGTGYKDPFYSFYPTPKGSTTVCGSGNTIQDIYRGCANTSNNNFWQSEAPSGMNIYTSPVIPGWRNSLLLASLKWGRIVRTKLNSAYTGLSTVDGVLDTMAYFGSRNRYRDLAVSPDGKDLFIVMDKSLSTSGPSQANPSALNCTGCVVKYTFLGYNDNAGVSTISTSIPIAPGLNNQLTNLTPTSVTTYENNNLWVPLTDSLGNIVAEVDANGNNLGNITGTMYKKTGSVRTTLGGTPYLDRSMTINVQTAPSTNVNVRIYLTAAELAALVAAPGSGVTNINSVFVYKNADANSTALTAMPATITPTRASFGSDYVLTASISGFSSFYIAGPSFVLPLDMLSLTGKYANQSSYLQWKTENENNTSVFVIEKSVNGQNFKAIATVSASGNTSTITNYAYTDNNLANDFTPVLYYRIKLVDANGAFKYSNTITVTLPSFAGAVSISPNPAISEMRASILSPADGKADWSVIDNAGRIILKGNTLIKKGNNQLVVNVNNLAAGAYYLHIAGNSIECKTKIQKL
jgi:glucose/arabinose dehydrogenase